MAKQMEEAFDHATTHDAMDTYATALGDDGSTDGYEKIAKYRRRLVNTAFLGHHEMTGIDRM
eukprot:COSAG05_NODE_2897_length_2529_cov_1.666667_2_plen_62_part_00